MNDECEYCGGTGLDPEDLKLKDKCPYCYPDRVTRDDKEIKI